jgi:hypothetical protein
LLFESANISSHHLRRFSVSVLHQECRDLAHGRVGAYRNHILGHGFVRFHGITSDAWPSARYALKAEQP